MQNGFFADFYFWAAGFFRGFSRRDFFSSFLWEKCPEKSSRKITEKILQYLYNKKSSDTLLQIGWGKNWGSKEGYWGQSKRGRGKRRNSYAIQVKFCSIIAQLCAIVEHRDPEKQGEVLGNQLFMVNYYVAFYELLRRLV